ncbi:hypothetical protein [Coleofasciculus sp. F4-SAH-05]|uniref:hypothetical protein n=1 Tax=Coleofasciculus sp. F4-SAH-05 TaxID=3069525 RepID=UPI0032F1E94F
MNLPENYCYKHFWSREFRLTAVDFSKGSQNLWCYPTPVFLFESLISQISGTSFVIRHSSFVIRYSSFSRGGFSYIWV